MAGERYISADNTCPCCLREIHFFFEYPRLKIVSLDILPPPNELIVRTDFPSRHPYDMSQAVMEAFLSGQVQEYLDLLREAKDKITQTDMLLPPKEQIEIKTSFPWSSLVVGEVMRVHAFPVGPKEARQFLINLSGIFGSGLLSTPDELRGRYTVSVDIARVGYEGFFINPA